MPGSYARSVECSAKNLESHEVSAMLLEEYFDFVTPDDIRIKGHRIGIDNVLHYYLEGYSPEEIAANLPSLSLEEIHATIIYYLRNRAQVDAYLSRLSAWRESRYQEWAGKPSPLIERLRDVRSQRQSVSTS
jgi:uncharacterized protein (DUF433 family)